MSDEIIKWKMTGDDPNDLMANFGDYTLRVERMDKKRYWWCLYFQSSEVIADYSGVEAETLKEGKKLCEVAFWTHRATYKKD
jgi:hypothetical protein